MRLNTTPKDTKNEMLDDFQALVNDTEKLLQHSASLVGEQADELRAHIRTTLGRARDSLRGAQGTVRDQSKAAVQATETYVQVHPWQSIGIAAAIGLVLGMLFTRR